jgi:hypothetical protein
MRLEISTRDGNISQRITSVVLLIFLVGPLGCTTTGPYPESNPSGIPMQSGLESRSKLTQSISFPDDACVPSRESTESARAVLAIGKTNPPSGSFVSESDILNVPLSYSVPTRSAEQYKLTAMVESSSPDKNYSQGYVDFPFPATCGTQGTVLATMSLRYFWNLPDVANPMRIRFVLSDTQGHRYDLISDVVEFSKRRRP